MTEVPRYERKKAFREEERVSFPPPDFIVEATIAATAQEVLFNVREAIDTTKGEPFRTRRLLTAMALDSPAFATSIFVYGIDAAMREAAR